MANSSGGFGMKLIIGFAAACLALGILSQSEGKNSISEISATDFTIILGVITMYTGFIILSKTKTEGQYVLLSLMKFWYNLIGHVIIMGTIIYCLIYVNNTMNYVTRDILKTYKELEFSFKHFFTALFGGILVGMFSVGFSHIISLTLENGFAKEDE